MLYRIVSHHWFEQTGGNHLLDALAVAMVAPLTSCFSGFMFLKFLHFVSTSHSKEQRFARVWGSIAFIIHLAQVIAQLENAFVSLTHYVLAKPYNMLLYEGIETLSTVFIVIIVQIHFSRVVHALVNRKRRWSLFASTSGLVTSLGGIGTAILLIMELSHGWLEEDTPAKLSIRLTICWTLWLSSATFFDITLTSVLTHQVLQHRTWTLQKSFRTRLSRILLITVHAFLMTSLTSVVVVVVIAVSTLSPVDDHLLPRFRITAFISNSFLPRIYLLAFCATLRRKQSSRGNSEGLNEASLTGGIWVEVHERESLDLEEHSPNLPKCKPIQPPEPVRDHKRSRSPARMSQLPANTHFKKMCVTFYGHVKTIDKNSGINERSGTTNGQW